MLALRYAAFVAVAAAVVAAGPARAQTGPAGGQAFGDWRIECEQPIGASAPQCALVQHVTAADRADVGLSVVVLKTADGQVRLLRVVAPMGVLLTAGLGLVIDGEMIGTAGYVRCIAERIPQSRENEVFGCIAEAVIDESLEERLAAGADATFIIFQTPEEGIGIPITLTGFAAGLAALP